MLFTKFIIAALFALSIGSAQAAPEHLIDWVQAESHYKMTRPAATRVVRAALVAAKKHRLDVELVLAVARQETGFRASARSFANARGVMQVIPRWHGEKIRGRNINDIRVGFDVGAHVLAEYLASKQGNTRRALAKYSGGARRYADKVLRYRASILLAGHTNNEKFCTKPCVLANSSYNLATPKNSLTRSSEKQDDNSQRYTAAY